MTNLAMNNGYRWESMQSYGMEHLTTSPLGQNRRFAFLAISHQTSGRGLDAKLDQNAIEPKR